MKCDETNFTTVSRVVDLNLVVFFVSAELFERFWKIRETILEWFSVDREKKTTIYYVLADKQQNE